MPMLSVKREDLLPGDEICKLNENDKVMVNSNRLYWQLSEASRQRKNSRAIRTIIKTLENITNDQALYVVMEVKDIKICFGNNLKNMPINTFRAIS